MKAPGPCPRCQQPRSLFDWDSAKGRWDCRHCRAVLALARARNKLGLCADCPAPIRGPGARRCAPCQVIEQRRQWMAAYHRKVATEKGRKRYNRRFKLYRRRPELREKNRKYCEAWRAEHPWVQDDAQRLYKREYMRQRRAKARAT